MKLAKARFIPAYLTIALLLGLTAETRSRPRPADADPFHTRVKAFEINFINPEGWTSQDQKIPDGAAALLRPNLTICRQYFKPRFQFLLVQCRDARDMGGHYPPVCYPASGCVVVGDEHGRGMTWNIGGKSFIGKEYEFSHFEEGQTRTQVVDNLLILPRGSDCYVQDIKEVRAFAADYLSRFYGAAQIQFVFDEAVPDNERRDIMAQLISKNMNLLTVLERSDEPRTTN
jgi:hypothetical protein